jgi:beta-glucosidase
MGRPFWSRQLLLTVLSTLIPFRMVSAQNGTSLPYRDSTLPIEQRVDDLLGRMTLEEKFWQLFMVPGDLDDPAQDFSHGIFGLQVAPAGALTGPAAARAHAERINAIQRYFVQQTRLGIPIIPFDEGVHGLPREGATVFPAAIALAASWDTALASRLAGATAAEAGSRGIRQLLSPVLNIASDVRWGRVEETYGEDPWLASLMGQSWVGVVERSGVVATPKHFVANVGEGGRDSYPIDWNQRKLEQYFFPPFRSAIQRGGARSIMSAYNSVNGIPATQNRWLLTTMLRDAWGFGGFVISDAAATGGPTVLQLTEATTATAVTHALEAGLDVILQSSYPQYVPYWAALEQGLIPDSTIDRAVRRVLRAKFSLGLFEHPYVDLDSAAALNGSVPRRALARQAAHEGIVLLKNTGALPLRPSLRSIAVIGTDAVEARLGGYSGPGTGRMTILDAIRGRLGKNGRVGYAPGPGRAAPEYTVIPAGVLTLRGEYFDNPDLQGTPALVRHDSVVDFAWTLSSAGQGIPLDWYSVRWTGTVTAPASGVRRIGVAGSDGYRLYLDNRLVIDNWLKRSAGATLVPVTLRPGQRRSIRLEYRETVGNGRVRLVWDAGIVHDWRARIESATAVARRSEAAIIVAGIEEGEFRDRALLGLPGHQEELIRAVARTGRPVTVVLIGGSAITMTPWLDSVAAVLDAWYPGEEGGQAIADVLFGDYDPAGRLPITFPLAEGQLPLYYDHEPTGRGDDYADLTGLPLFPFGHGLSYTSFRYSALSIEPATIDSAGTALVRCRVMNTGKRGGDEVVQLYLHALLSSMARPVLELRGFRRIHLEPGEEQEVAFTLGPEELRMLDREATWRVEPGQVRVLVGASSRDLRLRGTLAIK